MRKRSVTSIVQGIVKIYAGLSGIIGGMWFLTLTEGYFSQIVGAGIIIAGGYTGVEGIIRHLVNGEAD